MKRIELVRILRKIADAVERSKIAEWEDFDIELTPRKMLTSVAGSREGRLSKKAAISPAEVEGLLEQFKNVSTREAASEIIEKLDLTRRDLEALARPRSVHVTKDDSVKRIKEKLIEAIVGSRLNSAAIRGK